MRSPAGTTVEMRRIDGTTDTLTANHKPMSDYNDRTPCEACGRSFAYGQTATDQDGRTVHWSFDCTNPRNW